MNFKKRFVFFCFIGIIATLVDLIFFNILFYFNVNFILCRFFAILIAWSFVFTVNRSFTFSSKGIVKKQAPKFVIIYFTAMIINILVSKIIISFLNPTPLNGTFASIFGIISAIPITFFGSLLWVFKE